MLSYLSSTGSEQTGCFRSVLREQPGPSHSDPFTQSQWEDSGQGLTFIGHQVTSEWFIISIILSLPEKLVTFWSFLLKDCSASGNVHTGELNLSLFWKKCVDRDRWVGVSKVYECCVVGAVPPWMLEDPEDKSAGYSQDIGPSLQDFLKHSKLFVCLFMYLLRAEWG